VLGVLAHPDILSGPAAARAPAGQLPGVIDSPV
jgi:hypothetical protein